jgi:hypothetical protein
MGILDHIFQSSTDIGALLRGRRLRSHGESRGVMLKGHFTNKLRIATYF